MKFLLNDLRSNSKLQHIAPFLINFICQVVTQYLILLLFSRNIIFAFLILNKTQTLTNSETNRNSVKRKINAEYIQRALLVLKQLVLNKTLFLASKSYVNLKQFLYNILNNLKKFKISQDFIN